MSYPYTRSQTVLLLPLPYDVTNIVNSFLFYERVEGLARKQKKHICDLFTHVVPYLYENASEQSNTEDRVSRFSYFQNDATSVFRFLKDGDMIRQSWTGFCNSCGDFTHMNQEYDWQDEPEVEFYSPNVDVLCLCGLDGLIIGNSRRRPWPLGHVLE